MSLFFCYNCRLCFSSESWHYRLRDFREEQVDEWRLYASANTLVWIQMRRMWSQAIPFWHVKHIRDISNMRGSFAQEIISFERAVGTQPLTARICSMRSKVNHFSWFRLRWGLKQKICFGCCPPADQGSRQISKSFDSALRCRIFCRKHSIASELKMWEWFPLSLTALGTNHTKFWMPWNVGSRNAVVFSSIGSLAHLFTPFSS